MSSKQALGATKCDSADGCVFVTLAALHVRALDCRRGCYDKHDRHGSWLVLQVDRSRRSFLSFTSKWNPMPSQLGGGNIGSPLSSGAAAARYEP